MYPTKAEQKVHMSCERERRGLISDQRPELLHLLSLDQLHCAYPRGQWHSTLVTTECDGTLYTKISYSKPKGLLLMCLLWVRIMTRLIAHEFISVLEESSDGTKPVTYVTYHGGKQLYDH